jgi:hypothetical protein
VPARNGKSGYGPSFKLTHGGEPGREVHIRYFLPEKRTVEAAAYTLSGKRAAVMTAEAKAGNGVITWALNGNIPPGTYLFRIMTAGYSRVHRLTIDGRIYPFTTSNPANRRIRLCTQELYTRNAPTKPSMACMAQSNYAN